MTRRALLLAFFALLLLPMGGCGYRLLGGGEAQGLGGGNPAPLSIGSLDDRSREPLFGAILRRDLSGQASERAEIRLAAAGEPGALSLDVTVLSLTESGRSYVLTGLPREYLLTVTASAVLRDRAGKSRWKVQSVVSRREFPAGADANETRANKDAALRLLADDLAGEILRHAALAAGRIGRESP